MTLSAEICSRTQREFTVPVLATDRLLLRAPVFQDAGGIAQLANDRRIAVNTARLPHPYGVEDAEQFIARTNQRVGEATFVVTLNGAPIGACGIDQREGGPEIGYWLGVPYWGKGYATEAVRALIKHALTDLAHETLLAGARVSNPASRRVLQKCGFQWTGVQLTRIRAINSAAPTDRYRLDRRLWESLRSWGRVSRVA
ncbi:MAG: GNAT family N-acetyltransferase [Xanthobacteraceae bacterium]